MSVSACQMRPEKLENGRRTTEVDEMYKSLMVLNAKANCDKQYDPVLKESFVSNDSVMRQEVAKFLFVMGLGLTAVTLWRSTR